MASETKRSDQIYDYYISMEEVINNYIENKIEEQKKILELKDNLLEENKKILEEKDKILELKDKEIESIRNKKYDEIEKSEYVSIFTTDKDNIYSERNL